MKRINFRFMLIHGKGETTEDATFLNSLDVRYSQARHTMRYYYALPRCAAKSPVAYMSELCVHEWCPQVYVHVRISTCPPALPPISSPFEAALTLTLFQLPRKSRLREISTPPEARPALLCVRMHYLVFTYLNCQTR